ncbi:MAG: hypothetical protein EOP11_02550 [Proteobacteria bacterium]|nr:MAG: hypothetical protein EOP11_02550 [Pseudomonadota bacterium]
MHVGNFHLGFAIRLSLLILALLGGGGKLAWATVEVLELETYADPSKALPLSEVAKLGPWEKVGRGGARFGFSSARHWVRFRLGKNEGLSSSLIFDVPYVYNDRLTFFVTRDGKILHEAKNGLSVPVSAREKTELRTGSATFRWVDENAHDFTYYFSVEGNLPLGVPFTVRPGNEYVGFLGDRQVALGAFFGALVFAFLYNIFLGIALKSRVYLFYGAFVFFTTLLAFSHEGFSGIYLWPEASWWAEREIHFSGSLGALFYALFVAAFLETKKHTPRLHRWMFFFVAVSTIRLFWVFLIGSSEIVLKAAEASVISLNLLVLLIAGNCLFMGVRSARIFCISSLAYNLGFALFLLDLTNVINLGSFTAYSPHVGLLTEVVLLSLALAERIRRTNVDLRQSYLALDRETGERKRAEQLLEQERRETVHAEKLRALGRMAAGIAHEINNPLAIIHGNAVLLKDMTARGLVDLPALANITGTIEKTTERISRIVKSMRTLSRDSKQDPFSPCSLNTILQDTLAITQDRFRAGKITLSFPAEGPDALLLCRSAEICQVLVNLLGNSYDAVEASGGWVRVETRELSEEFEFAVSDSGPGIPLELRERIHEPFFTTKDVGRGTGLGLSISRSIVSAHGGSLWMDENSPHTKFLFTVPKA